METTKQTWTPMTVAGLIKSLIDMEMYECKGDAQKQRIIRDERMGLQGAMQSMQSMKNPTMWPQVCALATEAERVAKMWKRV